MYTSISFLSFFLFYKKQEQKKAFRGRGSPLPPVYVLHQRKFLYSSLISTHHARRKVERPAVELVGPWEDRFSIHLLLDVIPGTRLGCGAWMTVIWESLEQSEMESAWTRFEIKLRSKWIQSWRLIDARARSSYQYVQSENWNLEFGNKLLDGSSLFLAWLKKVISERTFFHWWTFSLSHLIRPFSFCL